MAREDRRALLWRLGAIAVLFAIGVPSKWYVGPGERYVVGQVWDVCGSAIVYLVARLLAPRVPPRVAALAVAATLVSNELLQLAHTPWLESLRQTLFGRIVLGSRFNPLDLVAIVGAVAITAVLDARLPTPQPPSAATCAQRAGRS